MNTHEFLVNRSMCIYRNLVDIDNVNFNFSVQYVLCEKKSMYQLVMRI